MLAPRCARCPANGRGYEWLRGGRDRDQSTASGSAGRWPAQEAHVARGTVMIRE